MKKANNTHLLTVSLFALCTAHVTLWGSDNASPKDPHHNGFYPYKTTTAITTSMDKSDLFMQEKTKEKEFLLHEKYSEILATQEPPRYKAED